MAAPLVQMGCFLRCNIFSYDYAGYGESGGKASEKNVYADVEAAYYGKIEYSMTSRWFFVGEGGKGCIMTEAVVEVRSDSSTIPRFDGRYFNTPPPTV